jgi:uncharacterized spore protein YtfJ
MKMKKLMTISLVGIFLLTSSLWAQEKSPLDESLSLFDKMTAHLKIDSVIGKPIRSGNTVVIPFARISYGMGSGGAMGGFGGGMGGKAIPFGVLIIEGNDVRVELFPVEEKKPSFLQQMLPVLMQYLPQLLEKRFGGAKKPAPPKEKAEEKSEECTGEKSLAEVKKLFEEENYSEALEIVESMIADDPDNADLYAWKGNVMGNLAQGSPMDTMKYGMGAMQAYDKALEIDPENAMAHFGRGMGRLMAPEGFGGDLDGAIEDFEFVVKKDPCHESYYRLGIAYKRKGLTEKAKKAFKKSLELKPDYTQAATALAELQ